MANQVVQNTEPEPQLQDLDSLSSSGPDFDNMIESEMQWIEWHVNTRGNEFLVEIDISFLMNSFTMFEFKETGDHEEALKMILGLSPKSAEELEDSKYLKTYQQAVDLYGLIHARYIQTKDGMKKVQKKFENKEFGVCPRVQCNYPDFEHDQKIKVLQPVLPVGMSNELNISKVKIYCPKCEDIYVPKGQRSAFSTGGRGCKINLDGAYFGTSFPYIFLLNH